MKRRTFVTVRQSQGRQAPAHEQTQKYIAPPRQTKTLRGMHRDGAGFHALVIPVWDKKEKPHLHSGYVARQHDAIGRLILAGRRPSHFLACPIRAAAQDDSTSCPA
jgi:hypothetical protein